MLGIKPILGRGFARADEQAGGGPGGLKVVLSYGFWQSHFNRADDVIGRVLMLDGRPNTVIGVMPEGFQFPIQTDSLELYTTMAEDASTPDGTRFNTQQQGNHWLTGIRSGKNRYRSPPGERGTADDRGGAGKKVSGDQYQSQRRIAATPR